MKIKPILISAIAVGLLAGSAVGVAAQDAEADPMAPSIFTTSPVDGPPDFSTDPETGLPVVTVEVEASDERAAGIVTNIEDGAEIEHGGQPYWVDVASVRLVNDGGSWVGTRTWVGSNAPPDGDSHGAGFTEYTGVDGYEGLSMYIFRMAATPGEPTTRLGFIFPTDEVPPFPAPPAAE